MKAKKRTFDVVVAGGGLAGVCAAVAAARNGADTALVQDRPVLGGNSSSEIRVTVDGAELLNGFNFYETDDGSEAVIRQDPRYLAGGGSAGALITEGSQNSEHLFYTERETGIIEEILLENRVGNPQSSPFVWDYVLYEFVTREPRLSLFLNASVWGVEAADDVIRSVKVWQAPSETRWLMEAAIFVDCTGDGVVAAAAGAEFRMGREARGEFGESFAPEAPDNAIMGETLNFTARDTGELADFSPPCFAHRFGACEEFTGRPHFDATGGYWWIEVSDAADPIGNRDRIREKLASYVFGMWDHLKNSGSHPGTRNLALDWVGSVPGRRESRRFMGDHILVQNDLVESREFPDVVGHGGWPVDEHCPGGIESLDLQPTTWHHYFSKPYSIPYRCLYSRNIRNLLLAGRNISASHVALASTRVMATCAVLGQAAGTAAAMCVRTAGSPRELGADRIEELQLQLYRDDVYLPGVCIRDPEDLALQAEVSAQRPGSGDVAALTDGFGRDVGSAAHHWVSESLPAAIELKWKRPREMTRAAVRLDSNVHRPIQMCTYPPMKKLMVPGLPPELAKRVSVEAFVGGRFVRVAVAERNIKRLASLSFAPVVTDRLRVVIHCTYGHPRARVFGVHCF